MMLAHRLTIAPSAELAGSIVGDTPSKVLDLRGQASKIRGKKGGNQMAKYEHIEVALSGQDGNAVAIMGRVATALRRASVSQEEIERFLDESMAGDYANVLRTAHKWVSVS